MNLMKQISHAMNPILLTGAALTLSLNQALYRAQAKAACLW
jgi:hypothetical protein